MIDNEYKEAITEVIDILNHSEKNIIEKIPKEMIEFLEENKSLTYKSNLDHSKKLEEMKLNEKTKEILTIIYKEYICDENEKEEISRILIKNENNHQEKLKEKYNEKNLFKNIKETEEIKEKKEKRKNKKENPKDITEYKNTIIQKIINRIKKWLNFRNKNK